MLEQDIEDVQIIRDIREVKYRVTLKDKSIEYVPLDIENGKYWAVQAWLDQHG